MADNRVIYVQESGGEVKKLTERKLRNSLSDNDLSGMELARWQEDEEWAPLYTLPIYKQVVPVIGDPRDVARRRTLRGLQGHAVGFGITAIVMLIVQGTLPLWLGIWAVFLALHTAKVLPTALELRKEGKSLLSDVPQTHDYKLKSADPFEEEARQIRELLNRINPPDKASLLDQVQNLVKTVHIAESKERTLELQTDEAELRKLQGELAQAKQHADQGGPSATIFQQQVDALQSRLSSIETATQAKAVLLAKKSVAVNHLKQLRLDLSAADANQALVGDLGVRLEELQVQMEADREVEALLSEQHVDPHDPDAIVRAIEARIQGKLEQPAARSPRLPPGLASDDEAEEVEEVEEQAEVPHTV